MRPLNKLFIFLFLSSLITPVAIKYIYVYKSTNIENRVKAKFPEFDITKLDNFINDFDKYYKESFGLRDVLFDLYSEFKYVVFNESPLPEKVLVGKNGWLFTGNAFGEGMKESIGIELFNEEELKAIRNKLLQNKAFLDSSNIKYYVFVAPDKQSINPEFLPYSLEKQKTKFDQLYSEMKKYPEVNMVDSRAYLIQMKDSVDLYFKGDSHWNTLGAFYGFEKLTSEIVKDFPEAKPVSINEYAIKKKNGIRPGDISIFMNQKFNETDWIFTSKRPRKIKNEDCKFSLPKDYSSFVDIYQKAYSNSEKKLKILVFRDSFTIFMTKYFTDSFGGTVLIWQPGIRKDVVDQVKPDIVIQEVVERNIDDLIQ